MSDHASFEAAAAARVTGVSLETLRDWRRRGFLPPIASRQGVYTARDLCKIRLLRALVDASLPIAFAAAHVSDALIDSLHSELRGVQFPEYANDFLAVIAYADERSYVSVLWSQDDLAKVLASADFDFPAFHIIRLRRIALDLVARGVFAHPDSEDR